MTEHDAVVDQHTECHDAPPASLGFFCADDHRAPEGEWVMFVSHIVGGTVPTATEQPCVCGTAQEPNPATGCDCTLHPPAASRVSTHMLYRCVPDER